MRIYVKQLLFATIILAALSACQAAPEGVEVYYIDKGGKAGPLQPVVSQLKDTDIEGIARALGAPPIGSGLVSAIGGAECTGYTLEGQDLTLDMSPIYAELSGVDLTVANACIVMTFTALPNVERVRVSVGGAVIGGYMGAELFMLDDTITPIVAEYDLYYIDESTTELAAERRRFIIRDGAGVERCLFDELLKADATDNRTPVVPIKTRIVSGVTDGGTLTVTLSRDFIDGEPPDQRLAALYIRGLVGSMCAIEGVERVRLLVAEPEGKASPLTEYGGVELPEYLTPEYLAGQSQ